METVWKIINTYFRDNPEYIVKHHLDSYNTFFKTELSQILQENNPIHIFKEQDPKTQAFRYQCKLYIGGKEGTKIYSATTSRRLCTQL